MLWSSCLTIFLVLRVVPSADVCLCNCILYDLAGNFFAYSQQTGNEHFLRLAWLWKSHAMRGCGRGCRQTTGSWTSVVLCLPNAWSAIRMLHIPHFVVVFALVEAPCQVIFAEVLAASGAIEECKVLKAALSTLSLWVWNLPFWWVLRTCKRPCQPVETQSTSPLQLTSTLYSLNTKLETLTIFVGYQVTSTSQTLVQRRTGYYALQYGWWCTLDGSPLTCDATNLIVTIVHFDDNIPKSGLIWKSKQYWRWNIYLSKQIKPLCRRIQTP